MNDELPDRLRVTAEEFDPDADRMWSRVAEGMRAPRGAAAPAERRRLVPHLALATGAALVLIGGVVLFGQGLGLGPSADPDPAPPAGGPGTQSESPSGTEEDTGGETTTSEGPSETGSSPDGQTSSEETGGEPEAPDWLTAQGSIDANNTDYFSQSVVKFRSERALTGLTVELRVAEGGGLVVSDTWTTDDNLFQEAVVTSEDGYTVLRWTLKDGAVVPAGNEYTLAGQFDPNGGPRSGADDSFTVTATDEDGGTGTLEGGF
ncbi:hypothetical protein SAMN05216298_4725 [Glycomyces sambucus]|uniref:Uncharacterized protein n=1 Tax=Glycomyces sambucus TaxID=380244 RepID=A0A1G9LY74_9ACTN|nr:hypothetical protein [Glycomyces sambucus]SDL67002.1 hypothetical protein SAMN05216298_4725 [Glycomyces sambucus]